MKPLKKFGQNYLTDKNIVKKMIDCLDIGENDSVIEIGPGKGFITEELYKGNANLIGVEIDTRVISDLIIRFPEMKIINGDFTKSDIPGMYYKSPLKIIGNIPFNKTGNILFKFLENIEYLSVASLIIPHDIGKRLTAKVRTKEYGILTVLFGYFSTVKLVAKISKNVFFPKPNMEAALVKISFNKSLRESVDNKLFIQTVKASFGNRRKTLYNSLRNSIFKECDFSGLDLPLNKRAEELSVEDYIFLTEYLQEIECLKRIK